MDGNCYMLNLKKDQNTQDKMFKLHFPIQQSEMIILPSAYLWPTSGSLTHTKGKDPPVTITSFSQDQILQVLLFIFIIETVVTVRPLSPPLRQNGASRWPSFFIFLKRESLLQPCCLSCQKTKPKNLQGTPLKEITLGRKKVEDRKERKNKRDIFLCLSNRHE